MSAVGQREFQTQRRVVAFFQNALGYKYLGHWKDRPDNRNVERELVADWLKRQGHSDKIIDKVLFELNKAAALGGSKNLYDANRETYSLLRYGVKIQPGVGEQTVTIWLIDWKNPGNNDFAIAEEVTVTGENTKRPDLVLYVNGIALGVLELKRSTVSVTEGIRQNLDSQKKEFIQSFFATVQLVMAGNDTEGLRYGVIETSEKYWLHWKEAEAHPSADDNPLLRELSQLCGKERLLEIIHDFVVFDAGVKKICRHNQYFGVKAAQARVKRREGGIVWHTQGSGKSLTMVWLAKWIREHVTDARVLLITDRTELDEQIEKVFKGVSEDLHRTKSGADLVRVLNASDEWLIASLIHKFGAAEEGDVDTFVEDIRSHLPKNFYAKGEIFVFVDECHRTQSGKLHEAMKELLPGAMMIGFTGTPLLKSDKQRSIETFGPYIHAYKYDEAVSDGVVLDLRYEARDIDQSITSQTKIDQWFDIKTRGLTDVAKAQLKQRWGTMQRVLSARDRLEKIVADILFDMETRDRLKSGRGNAMLVSGSIYSACRFFDLFQQTELAGKCAIVTSYRPTSADIKGEETGEGRTEKILRHSAYRKMLAAHFNEPEETAMHKAEVGHYEKVRQEVKLASGDYIDLKVYEPAMRHLLDTYIRAEESEQLSGFDDLTLVELIVERGEEAVEALPAGIRKSRAAVAETIENNVRRLIIDETEVNPRYYENMSDLLEALIRQRKQEAIHYKEYLAQIVDLTRKINRPETQASYPVSINSTALRALFDNLVVLVPTARESLGTEPPVDVREAKVLALDSAIRRVKKADWRGSKIKEREVRNAIHAELGGNESLVNAIFEIVKAQRDY